MNARISVLLLSSSGNSSSMWASLVAYTVCVAALLGEAGAKTTRMTAIAAKHQEADSGGSPECLHPGAWVSEADGRASMAVLLCQSAVMFRFSPRDGHPHPPGRAAGFQPIANAIVGHTLVILLNDQGALCHIALRLSRSCCPE